jgi:hypothetical protein
MRAPLLIVSLLLLLSSVPVAGAGSGEVGELRSEVTDLKRALERLQSRVDYLEQLLPVHAESAPQVTPSTAPAPAATPSPVTSEAVVRERWRKVAYDMTPDQVEALLGPANRTIKLDAKTVWHYSYPDIGSGSVVFSEGSGVTDWHAPPSGFLW